MVSKKIAFKNVEGESLSGRLELPASTPKAYALFAHCFTCSKNLNAVRNIAKALIEEGIAVLRFDFTGLGQSEGDFANTNFSSNVSDLISAANFLSDEYEAPQLLIGHSLGGAAVLMAASQLPATQTVATIGAPCDPEHVAHMLRSEQATIEQEGKAEVELAGRRFTIKKQFLDDLQAVKMKDAIAALKPSLLVMHSPIDNTVSIDNAAHIFQTAKHPKSFVTLDNADHLLSSEDDAHYVGHVIATWASRYVQSPVANATTVWHSALDETAISAYTQQGYKTELFVKGHHMIADEPLKLGGTDLGATPTGYLAAALASCTTITLRMYANRKEWPVESIQADIFVEQERNAGKVTTNFRRELLLTGDLNQEQKERMQEIAGRCPVHRTLEGEVTVETILKG